MRGKLYFPDVDTKTGHTLVHYLHKEAYETPITNDDSPLLEAYTKLKAALLVYIATSKHDLVGLQQLAIHEIEEHGSNLDIFEILRTIDDDFSKLRPNSWVHDYLQQKAKVAFEQDHTVFTNEAFLQDLNNASLIKFMARCTVNLYNTRLSQMLTTEKELCPRLHTKDQCVQNRQLNDSTVELEQNVVFHMTPGDKIPVEECDLQGVEDVATSEGFCTISCPPSEAPDGEVEPCLYENNAGFGYGTPKHVIEEIRDQPCEVTMETPIEPGPGVPDRVPDSPRPVSYEPTWEPSKDEIASIPTENDALICVAPVEPEPVDPDFPQESDGSPSCPFQTRHLLKGMGWKKCKRCRKTLKKLLVEVPGAT